MNLKEVMDCKTFVVVGNTTNPEKYAYKIKHTLLNAGYTVYCVGKELGSINDVPVPIDIIDMCINPIVGFNILKENKKQCKCIVLQPGARNDEITDYLSKNNTPYLEDCVLIGSEKYPRK